MPVTFTRAARTDLKFIALYIGKDSPKRAKSFVMELEAKSLALNDYPISGADRSHICDGLRVLPHGHYNIFYRTLSDRVEITRILHSARHIDEDDINA